MRAWPGSMEKRKAKANERIINFSFESAINFSCFLFSPFFFRLLQKKDILVILYIFFPRRRREKLVQRILINSFDETIEIKSSRRIFPLSATTANQNRKFGCITRCEIRIVQQIIPLGGLCNRGDGYSPNESCLMFTL